MIEWIIKFSEATMTFNSFFGIILYWVPLTLCVFGYTLRTARNIQVDRAARAQCERQQLNFYTPTDKLGDLIGRAVVSIVPLANLWAGLFDVSPVLFRRFFHWVGMAFNTPLVPKRPISKAKGEV